MIFHISVDIDLMAFDTMQSSATSIGDKPKDRKKATVGSNVITSLEYVGDGFFSSLLDDGMLVCDF